MRLFRRTRDPALEDFGGSLGELRAEIERLTAENRDQRALRVTQDGP